MRIEGVFRAGFYPTPISEYRRIHSLIAAPQGSPLRILDPCAGEGEAIQEMALHLRKNYSAQPHVYACEISQERVTTHNNTYWQAYRSTTSLASDWKQLRTSNEGFQLLWLNPPYDWGDDERDEASKKKARLEYLFLRDTLPKLQHGGTLVYIVPEKLLAFAHVRHLLANNLKQICVYRFGEEEYKAYSQIVLIGQRREAGPSPEQEEMLERYAGQGVPAYDPTTTRTYMLPQPGRPTVIFQRSDIPDADLLTWLAESGGVHRGRAFQDYITPPESDFQPLVAPRTGHAATLLASGMMGVLRLGDTLIKGNTTRAILHYDAEGLPLAANESDKAKKSVTTFSSEIHEVNTRTGEFRAYTDPIALQELFTKHAAPLTEAIFNRYKPLYDGHINGQGPTLDAMMPGKKLPGQKKAGMLSLQKQLAVAAETACRKYGVAILVGEMGLGKSVCSLATGEILNAYPMVVLTPAHLVNKWVRECQDSIPACNPMALRSISDVDAFFKEYSDPTKKGIGVISKETAKLGPGWTPSNYVTLRQVKTTSYDPTHDIEREIKTMQRFVACPKCGKSQEVNALGTSTRKFCKGKIKMGKNLPLESCSEPLYQYGRLSKQQVIKRQSAWEQRNLITDKALKDALAVGHKWPLSKYIKSRNYKIGLLIADELHKYKGKSTDQGRAFHNLVRQSRYTVGLTGTLFGGKASDLYFMLYRMFPRSFKAEGYNYSAETPFINKYGRLETIYRSRDDKEQRSGVTTGMKREVIEVREIPGISPGIYRYVLPFAVFAKIDDLGVAMPAFKEQIHRFPMESFQRAQYDAATKLLMDHIREGFKSFDSTAMHEAHALMGAYLQMALSRPNSSFRREEQWWKPLTDSPRKPYWVYPNALPTMPTAEAEDADVSGWEHAMDDDEDDSIEAFADKQHLTDDSDDDEPGVKQPRQAATPRSRDPDAPMPPPGMEPMVLDPTITFGQLLPKEQWLVDTIKEQVKRSRQSIVYVRQTGTRDIQPRIQHILELAGIRAVILPDGDPSKREEWIHKNHCDVLITNPMKVETGLDLVQFQTIIFYEMTYSLFVFWQALRRVWRLGQTKAVEVHYAVYEQSMEEDALALMGHKMKAAHLLYGDSAETAVSGAVDGQDIMAELTQKILNRQHITTDGITGLVGEMGGALAEDGFEAEPLTDYSEESEDATVPAGEAVIEVEAYSVGDAVEEPIEEPEPQHELIAIARTAFFGDHPEIAYANAQMAKAQAPPLLNIDDVIEAHGFSWTLRWIENGKLIFKKTPPAISPDGAEMESNWMDICADPEGVALIDGITWQVEPALYNYSRRHPGKAVGYSTANTLPELRPAAQPQPARPIAQQIAGPTPALRMGHIFTYYGRPWVLTKPVTIRGLMAPTAHLAADKAKTRTWKSVEHFELDSGLKLAPDWAAGSAPAILPEPPATFSTERPVLTQQERYDLYVPFCQTTRRDEHSVVMLMHGGLYESFGDDAMTIERFTSCGFHMDNMRTRKPQTAVTQIAEVNAVKAIAALLSVGYTVIIGRTVKYHLGTTTVPQIEYVQRYTSDVPPIVQAVAHESVQPLPEVEPAFTPEPVQQVVRPVVQPKAAPTMAELYAKFGKNGRGK